jgi:hypothetical protein
MHRLLGHFRCVVYLNAWIPHPAPQLGVAEQEPYRAQILRAAIDEGGLGTPHCVGAIRGGVETYFVKPLAQST